MSISFSCECGKKLAAKDDFAGRRLKCPGCGKSLTIPARPAVATQLAGSHAGAGAAGSGTRLVLRSPGFVHFSCDCGRRMRAHLADIGQDIDCPRCGREMAIPLANGEAPVTATGGQARPQPTSKAAPKLELTPLPVKVTWPKEPPVTKRIDPLPPLTARAPVAPATTRTVQAVEPDTGKSLPASDPKTSLPAPAPPTTKAPALAGPPPGDGLFGQRYTPWRGAQTKGPAPKEPKVGSWWPLPTVALIVLALLAGEWYLVEESRGTVQPMAGPEIGPLAKIPAVAVAVTTFHVGGEQGPAAIGDLAQKHLKQSGLQWHPNDLERVTVILMEWDALHAPRYIEPLTLISPNKAPPKVQPKAKAKDPTTDQVIIVQTRQPFDKADLLWRGLETRYHFGKRIGRFGYSRPLGWVPDHAICIIDPQTFVFGSIAGIDHFVRAQSVDGMPQTLEPLGKSAPHHDFVMEINLTKLTPFGAKEKVQPLKDFRSALVTRDEDRQGKNKGDLWVLRMVYASDQAAKAARKALDPFKIPEDAVEVSGATLQVRLEPGGSNPAEAEALLASVMGVVHPDSTLRSRDLPAMKAGLK
jgi:DNA-directed RNA polymerase subunit RPC12/RpoP